MARLYVLFVIYILLFFCSWNLDSCHASDNDNNRTSDIPSLIHVGAVLDMNSPLGSMADLCIRMALSDFYLTHPKYMTRLELHVKNANTLLDANFAVLDLLNKEDVDAILGPEGETENIIIAELGEKVLVPMISFTTTSSIVSYTNNRYFVRATSDDAVQAKALAAVCQGFEWPTTGILRVGVPWKQGFTEFVYSEIDHATNHTKATGFAIDIFLAALKVLPFPINYEFQLFNDTENSDWSYDEMLQEIPQNFDMVVGDTTIRAPRATYVEFSLPYSESGVILVVKNKKPSHIWIFIQPLRWDLWLAIIVACIIMGIVLHIMDYLTTSNNEDQINQAPEAEGDSRVIVEAPVNQEHEAENQIVIRNNGNQINQAPEGDSRVTDEAPINQAHEAENHIVIRNNGNQINQAPEGDSQVIDEAPINQAPKAENQIVIRNNGNQINQARKKRFGTVYLSPIAVLAFPESRMVSNNWSFLVLVFWMFMAFILMQAYTANFAAILTVDELKFAFSDDYYVGYQTGSFMKHFLTEQLHISASRLRNYTSAEEYHKAMSLGSKRGGIDAIFDETPYMKLFLKKYDSRYKMVGPTYRTGGFGFAFPIGSPLPAYFSKAILSVTQGPEITAIEQKNFGPGYSSQDPLSSTISQRTSSLTLYEFTGLFIIVGSVTVFALLAVLCSRTRQGRRLISSVKYLIRSCCCIQFRNRAGKAKEQNGIPVEAGDRQNVVHHGADE